MFAERMKKSVVGLAVMLSFVVVSACNVGDLTAPGDDGDDDDGYDPNCWVVDGMWVCEK